MSGLFPMFSFPQDRTGALPLYRDVQMDYEMGRPMWAGGAPVLVTGLEAVRGWAWRAVDTARYRFPVFSWSFGCELETLVGQPYRADTKRSEAERYVREALLVSPYIREAQVTETAFEGSTLHIAVDLTTAYHNPKAKVHDQALEYLKQGCYLIALMKKGTWTGGGHFVVVWWADNKIRINDPASTKDKRLNGDPATFRNEAAYYWVIDARKYNNTPEEEDDNMDQDKFNKMFATAMQQYRQELRDNDSGEWSRAARQFAIDRGIFAGGGTAADGQPNFMWEDFLTREQCAQVLYRFAQKFGLA